MKSKSGRVAFTALLAALALALSFLEGLLPPLPMMPPAPPPSAHDAPRGQAGAFQPGHHVRRRQPGPAQRPVFGGVGLPSALFLAVFKGVFALVTRGGMAGLMSLSGGVISTVVMWLLLKKANASLGVVGVCGALAHNAAQLCAAYFLTSTSVLFYVPFLVLFGVLTGLLTGHRHQRGLLRALPGAVRRAHRAADRACAQADAEAFGGAVRRAHRAADRACAQADAEALGAPAKHPEVKLFANTKAPPQGSAPAEVLLQVVTRVLAHHFTWQPPHSTTVKPLRSGPASSCGGSSTGSSRGFQAMNTRSTVSGVGVMVSRAASV